MEDQGRGRVAKSALVLVFAWLCACGGDGGTKSIVEPDPPAGPTVKVVSADVKTTKSHTSSLTVVENTGTLGKYTLLFFVKTDAGDSLSRSTPVRLIQEAKRDTANWLVANSRKEIARVEVWQEDAWTPGESWELSETWIPTAGGI